jgi:flagellar hook-associated protein 3 FlgL
LREIRERLLATKDATQPAAEGVGQVADSLAELGQIEIQPLEVFEALPEDAEKAADAMVKAGDAAGEMVPKLIEVRDENGKLVYTGDQTVSMAGIADQSSVDTNRAGTRPFDKIVRTADDGKLVPVGFFQVIDDLSAALQSNDSVNIRRAVGEVQTLQQGLSDSLASIGAAVNKLDNQVTLAEENMLRMRSTLSQAEDTDFTEAITKMNKDMLALEAAQSSFAKIAQLNLFDYIR